MYIITFESLTNSFGFCNKHTVSIAEAINVPYRPNKFQREYMSPTGPTNFKEASLQKEYMKGYKSEKFLYYVNKNPYPKLDVNCKTTEKCRKLNLTKENMWCAIRSNAIKIKLDLYYVKTNSYTKVKSISQDKRGKSRKKLFLQKATRLYTKFQVNISKDD